MTAVGFAAALMAAITPKILGDASFQLTFMSTLGMVVIAPRLQGWGKNIITNKLPTTLRSGYLLFQLRCPAS